MRWRCCSKLDLMLLSLYRKVIGQPTYGPTKIQPSVKRREGALLKLCSQTQNEAKNCDRTDSFLNISSIDASNVMLTQAELFKNELLFSWIKQKGNSERQCYMTIHHIYKFMLTLIFHHGTFKKWADQHI